MPEWQSTYHRSLSLVRLPVVSSRRPRALLWLLSPNRFVWELNSCEWCSRDVRSLLPCDPTFPSVVALRSSSRAPGIWRPRSPRIQSEECRDRCVRTRMWSLVGSSDSICRNGSGVYDRSLPSVALTAMSGHSMATIRAQTYQQLVIPLVDTNPKLFWHSTVNQFCVSDLSLVANASKPKTPMICEHQCTYELLNGFCCVREANDSLTAVPELRPGLRARLRTRLRSHSLFVSFTNNRISELKISTDLSHNSFAAKHYLKVYETL